jgi:hypothetical protein
VTLPLSTTTVAVERIDGMKDPYENDPAWVVASGMRAVIGSPSGDELRSAGERERVDAVAQLPAQPLVNGRDTIVDEQTGDVWQVVWVRTRLGLGLDHQRAGLRAISGEAGNV